MQIHRKSTKFYSTTPKIIHHLLFFIIIELKLEQSYRRIAYLVNLIASTIKVFKPAWSSIGKTNAAFSFVFRSFSKISSASESLEIYNV